MAEAISIRHETKTVTDLVNLFERRALNLSPTFQRKSVWTEKDRRKLVDTLVRNFPIPALFLYERQEDGKLKYDVIDGKQRLETLLGFLGHLRGHRFIFEGDIPGFEGKQRIDARTLRSNRKLKTTLLPQIMRYRIPVIEVSGDLGDIVELFVRINSTGKTLTSQERRNARYSGSELLKQSQALANKLMPKFESLGVFSAGQFSRMKHVEFAAELILSIHQGDVINKKMAVDKVMSAGTIPASQLIKASRKAFSAISRIARMFPRLDSTRFCKVVDFYTLAVLISKLESEGAAFTEKRRNDLAWGLLKAFGIEVDRLREAQRKLAGIKPEQEGYREYLMTVSAMTDDVAQRQRREKILREVIGPIFAKKDSQRGFTVEQRRILWSASKNNSCESCGEKLTWNNFTIDHVDPYSKGGRSSLDNAAVMCRSCNSSKGNRRTKVKTSVKRAKRAANGRSR